MLCECSTSGGYYGKLVPRLSSIPRKMKRGGAGTAPQRAKRLLLAYRCSPYRGSEWAVGWGRVVETARYHDVIVITSDTSKADIERYSREHFPLKNVMFSYVGESAIQKALRIVPSIGAYHYLAYNQWQREALSIAVRLHREQKFDLVHHVNICGYREPGYLWKLPIPFVWGPVGGTQQYPWKFLFCRPAARGVVLREHVM